MSTYYPVPPELLYGILVFVLHDYFHEYILDETKPRWNAPATCILVSSRFRDCTHKVISHAMRGYKPEDSDLTLEELVRCDLDYLRKILRSRSEPLDVGILFVNNTPELLRIRKRPYTLAYFAYIMAHTWRELATDRYPDTSIHGDDDVAVQFKGTTRNMMTLSSKALQLCGTILPAGFGAAIGVHLTEEYWRITMQYRMYTVLTPLKSMADLVSVYIDQAEGSEQVLDHRQKTIKKHFENIQALLVPESDTLRKRYMPLYGISNARVGELTLEILTGFSVFHRLQELAASPTLKEIDPLGMAKNIHMLLAQLGFQ